MGKLICDSTASSPIIPWRDPTSSPAVDQSAAAAATWDNVSGLEDQQKRHLTKLHHKGVLWKPPGYKGEGNGDGNGDGDDDVEGVVFRLSHGGEVEADGNCLFTASQRAMGMTGKGKELRRRAVRRFLEERDSGFSEEEREAIDKAIRHMYYPDLRCGWGVHVVQEVKVLARKVDREGLDKAVEELVGLGMQR